MNPQQNSTSSQDKEPVVQVPEVPAVPTPAAPAAQPSGSTPPPAPTTLPDPMAAALGAQMPQPAMAPATATPATAGDVDIIEKEWVDKADEVVKKTEGDPHAEEEGVEELQTDYLKKRYDHTVDKSQEG